MRAILNQAKEQGVDPDMAATQTAIQHTKIMRDEQEKDNPSTYYGGNARRRIAMMQRRRTGR